MRTVRQFACYRQYQISKTSKHQLLDSVSVAEIKGVESWFNIIHFTGNIELFLMAYMA